MTLTTTAPAKINLGLFVLNKRPDGYHNIQTIFHRVPWCDVIEFSRAGEVSVVCPEHPALADATNLCARAARKLQERTGFDGGVRITLNKRIPIGAGLGGGSSDAAAVLLSLPSFWDLEVPLDTLRAIALELGSDVPFFLGQGSALGEGRGEQLHYFPLDVPFTVLLCNPGIHISTAWAYGHLKVDPMRKRPSLRTAVVAGLRDAAMMRRDVTNDFEEAIFPEHPAIRAVKEEMLNAGAHFSLMSGSGSTVYGLFAAESSARAVAESLSGRGFSAMVASTGSRP